MVSLKSTQHGVGFNVRTKQKHQGIHPHVGNDVTKDARFFEKDEICEELLISHDCIRLRIKRCWAIVYVSSVHRKSAQY